MFLTRLLSFLRKKEKNISHKKSHLFKKKDKMSDTESTPSMPSSEGKNYTFIDGRRYNNDEDVGYLLPNDNDEADRLHQQHWIMKYALKTNYHAPMKEQLEQGINVIDSGCGPATWTFDMAEAYPNSKFTGADISFVFPEAVKPANVEFAICNMAREVSFEENSFDYYFQRYLIGGLTRDDWGKVLKNAYKILKPGAYIELVEPNMEYENMGPILASMQKAVITMVEGRGMIKNAGDELPELLEEAGFVNLTFTKRPLYLNHSGKIGQLWWDDVAHALTNLRPVMAMTIPEYEDVDAFKADLDRVAEECAEMKSNFVAHIAYAQKPLDY
ncbi:S-adenosyl-L-methionine-dependent methyltransferase [Pilobolus umbonatus]|nr:S-adenosyl-L-methionine-dependent methyltransferase [Pilobolus umbonatus]